MPNVPDTYSGHDRQCWRSAFLRADGALGWWIGQNEKVRTAERMLRTREHRCTCGFLPTR